MQRPGVGDKGSRPTLILPCSPVINSLWFLLRLEKRNHVPLLPEKLSFNQHHSHQICHYLVICVANRLAHDLELPAKPNFMKAMCGLETGSIVYRSHLISFKFLDPVKSNARHCVFSEARQKAPPLPGSPRQLRIYRLALRGGYKASS